MEQSPNLSKTEHAARLKNIFRPGYTESSWTKVNSKKLIDIQAKGVLVKFEVFCVINNFTGVYIMDGNIVRLKHTTINYNFVQDTSSFSATQAFFCA